MHLLLRRLHLLSTISSSSGSRDRTASAGSATSSPHSSSSSVHSRDHNNRNITISHVNINSITSRCRLDELSHFAFLNDIDILCLTETKLDETIHPSLFTLDDYHSPLTKHRNRNGGGVAIYIRNNLAVKRLPNLETTGVEWVWCLVKVKFTTLLICSMYVPPNLSSEQYSLVIAKLSESILAAEVYAPDNIIILGDFNAGNTFLDPKFSKHSPLTHYEFALHDEILSSNLEQLIHQPTRYAESNEVANLRDLALVSNVAMVENSGVFPSFSRIDHIPIFVSLKIEPPSTSKQTIQCWDYRQTDTDKLTRLLMDTDWDSLLDCDVDNATENLTDALLTAAKATIPFKVFTRNSNNKPWFNLELKCQIRRRDRLFKIAKKRDTPQDWERWRRQRNLTTETNQRLKTLHIQSEVTRLFEHKRDPRTYHSILKGLIGKKGKHVMPPLISQDGTPITDEYDKATILNEHFANQARLNTHDKDLPQLHSPTHVPHLMEVQVTEQEVLKMLNSLDTNKSAGPDKVPNKLLKMCALLIANPLCKLFNKSLQAGIFPLSWKKACVTPIFKQKGSRSDPTNYRPISLLPNLSKILEKLVFNKIYEHLSENNLLTEKQSGYRPGHSTHIQLLYLTHQLYSALNENKNFTAIFLDISKYFDKIWHEALIAKCEIQYNLSGSLLVWLKSYLQDRSQVVCVGSAISESKNISAGCPQGSVLGPLLALMYLNDLSKLTENDALFYADDTSLYLSHPQDSQQHRLSLQNDLDMIRQYGTDWAITFNADKTVQQTFTNRRNDQDLELFFDGQPLLPVTCHKHLGLHLSTDLHFHEHINSLIRTINSLLGPIYPVARFLPRSVLNEIYVMYIRPHFDYCDIIYDGNLTASDSIRLQTIQNRCARLVTGTLFRTPTNALLNDLGWERLETRRLIHRLLFFHRLYYNYPPLPSYLTNLLTNTRHDATGLQLRNAHLLSVPSIRLTSFRKSYIPATTRQWNLLPEPLRNSPSRRDFSRQVWQRFGAPEPSALNYVGTKALNTQHTRLRVGLSTLHAHLFQLQLMPSPSCSCGHTYEDTAHYLLWCPLYTTHRTNLFNAARRIVCDFDDLSTKNKLELLLFGRNISQTQGIDIAHHLQTFIALSNRLNTHKQHNTHTSPALSPR